LPCMREGFSRAKRAADLAAKGAPRENVPIIEHQSFVAKTEHSPFWVRKGLIFKKYGVLGLAGEPIVRNNRTVTSYNLQLGDKSVVIRHAPFGWADLGDGRYALFSIHHHGGNELSVVVHGVVDSLDPEKNAMTQYAPAKHLPQYAGSNTLDTLRYDVTAHWVVPVSEKDYPVVENRILSMLQSDLARVFSEKKDDAYWEALNKAHREFSKLFEEYFPDAQPTRSRIGRSKDSDLAGGFAKSFTHVQKILATHEDVEGINRYELPSAIADFQRELAWQLHLKDFSNSGIAVGKIKSRVGSKDVVDLRRWLAYPRIVETYYRYLKSLRSAIQEGKLRVNFIHRVG